MTTFSLARQRAEVFFKAAETPQASSTVRDELAEDAARVSDKTARLRAERLARAEARA